MEIAEDDLEVGILIAEAEDALKQLRTEYSPTAKELIKTIHTRLAEYDDRPVRCLDLLNNAVVSLEAIHLEWDRLFVLRAEFQRLGGTSKGPRPETVAELFLRGWQTRSQTELGNDKTHGR